MSEKLSQDIREMIALYEWVQHAKDAEAKEQAQISSNIGDQIISIIDDVLLSYLIISWEYP